MTQIFNGKLHVHYGQAYVSTYKGPEYYLSDCFSEQVNGLCGTAFPGVIFLVTGLHTGKVGLSVEVLEFSPPPEDEWEEIVEAPFSVGLEADEEGVRLEDWSGNRVCSIPLSLGDYRVRYCAKNMKEGRDVDTLVDKEPIDFYKLSFWPSQLKRDAILRKTSRVASYWHKTAQGCDHFDATS